MTSNDNVPLRALTAVALCDGHDAAIVAVSRALRHSGFEVVYIGFHKSPRQIVQAAVQEDVDVIGISSYNGGHFEFLDDVMRLLKEAGRSIPVVCGGGGTMTKDDETELAAIGVARVFLPGESLEAMAAEVRAIASRHRRRRSLDAATVAKARAMDPAALGEAISAIEEGVPLPKFEPLGVDEFPILPFVVGICGPGGAGKSTLIDELCLRWLAQETGPLAVLCSDPTTGVPGERSAGGALLGDRLRMIATDNPRLFVRSFGTRRPGAMSAAVAPTIEFLRHSACPLVIVESAGIGQSDRPYGAEVDLSILVMTDEFGSAIQLEKLSALEAADLVVLNKSDRPSAQAALSMIRSHLRSLKRTRQRDAEALTTSASTHHDPGVNKLFEEIQRRRALRGEPATAK